MHVRKYLKLFFVFSFLLTGIYSSAQQKMKSVLEIYNVETGKRTALKVYPYQIEAPNWTPDSNCFAFVSYEYVD